MIMLLVSSALVSCSGGFKTKNINGSEIEIDGYRGTTIDNLIIPATIKNKKVTSISTSFSGLVYSNIGLPSTIKNIGTADLLGTHDMYFDGTIEEWCDIEIADTAQTSNYNYDEYPKFYILDSNGSKEFNNNKYSELIHLVIPNSIVEIGQYAFFRNYSLESVTIGSNVKTIGKEAFATNRNYTHLKEVFLGQSVEEVKQRAFEGCNKIDTLVLNEGLKILGNQCFYGLASLSTIVVPSTITKLGSSIFEHPISIYYRGNQAEWDAIEKENDSISVASLYYYSESEPIDTGNYWHYDNDNKPIAW